MVTIYLEDLYPYGQRDGRVCDGVMHAIGEKPTLSSEHRDVFEIEAFSAFVLVY